MEFIHNKTGKIYLRSQVVTNATNDQDGERGIIYYKDHGRRSRIGLWFITLGLIIMEGHGFYRKDSEFRMKFTMLEQPR